jgi:poly(A) polymerase
LTKTLSDIDKIEIPNFPFSGKYVMDQGIDDGKKIGLALKELEKQWIENDFNLQADEAISVVNQIKKLNILNI